MWVVGTGCCDCNRTVIVRMVTLEWRSPGHGWLYVNVVSRRLLGVVQEQRKLCGPLPVRELGCPAGVCLQVQFTGVGSQFRGLPSNSRRFHVDAPLDTPSTERAHEIRVVGRRQRMRVLCAVVYQMG